MTGTSRRTSRPFGTLHILLRAAMATTLFLAGSTATARAQEEDDLPDGDADVGTAPPRSDHKGDEKTDAKKADPKKGDKKGDGKKAPVSSDEDDDILTAPPPDTATKPAGKHDTAKRPDPQAPAVIAPIDDEGDGGPRHIIDGDEAPPPDAGRAKTSATHRSPPVEANAGQTGPGRDKVLASGGIDGAGVPEDGPNGLIIAGATGGALILLAGAGVGGYFLFDALTPPAGTVTVTPR